MKRDSRTPLIVAIALLLLPVLYVGSYLALVRPGPNPFDDDFRTFPVTDDSYYPEYRFAPAICRRFFWPLEQIDRKVRPEAWEPSAQLPSPHQTTIGEDGLERIGIDFK